MHIGVDARSLGPLKTGVGTYLSEVLKHWPEQNAGDKISLFSHQPIIFPSSTAFNHRVTHARWGLPWYLFRSAATINPQTPDVFWGAQNLLPVRLSSSVPAVLTIHDCVHHLGVQYAPSRLYNWLHRYFLPRALQRALKVIAVSRFVADEVMRRFQVHSAKIEVTPLGVQPQFFEAPFKDSEIARVIDRYQLKRPFILGVGTLEPRKNLKTLLEAFALLPDRLRREYQLVLVGKTGWKMGDLQKQLSDFPEPSRLKLLGYVSAEDLPYLYAAADMFVFPSLYEGFGLPVVEAMAAGCPVVVSSVSALPEIVGSAGILVDPHGPPATWSQAMAELADSIQLRRSLSEAGSSQARKFSWEVCARRTAEVVRRVASSASGAQRKRVI